MLRATVRTSFRRLRIEWRVLACGHEGGPRAHSSSRSSWRQSHSRATRHARPVPPGETGVDVGEPPTAVDPANGNIYVTSATGVPCGATTDECVVFWRSTDGGASFVQPAPTAFLHPLGGGDDDVIHDGASNIFIDDLRSLLDTGVYRSTDHGNTWTSTDTGPCSDRPWLAWGGWNAPTGLATIYETQNSGACTPGALFQFWRSIDDGLTFLPVGVVNADLQHLGYTADSSVQGGFE